MDSISISIPSLSDNIRMIESFIDNAKERFNLTDDIYGNIMIAVTESVNNAIRHGNKGDSKKNVDLSLKLNDGAIVFWVKDEGDGFDFNNLPDPTAPENLDRPGGRGIFLMKHLSDEVNFHDEGCTVELVFYIN
uniref:ATP-binding protein n=1 Tax=Roseihalotalea indica TaxID=2867963 RepID=A0AA49JHY3_9BACT|nr:ATP-binding protein [Tunicatimonas sp. TK19036]